MCDAISAFPAVQSDSRSCHSCAQRCTSVHECSVRASAASLYCSFSLQLLLDVLSHVCYSLLNRFLYRFNRLQEKKDV